MVKSQCKPNSLRSRYVVHLLLVAYGYKKKNPDDRVT